mmetsp:Transcript_5967/g.5128  ORF Transcript_5967/g.5128 Transcript_5967/m.5128 type:complete len:145 (+) Transcript_5967:462-896(+)
MMIINKENRNEEYSRVIEPSIETNSSNLQYKYDNLEKENIKLKEDNYEIKKLYEDRLEELNWYYNKYGRMNYNRQQDFTQVSENDLTKNHYSIKQLDKVNDHQRYGRNDDFDYRKMFSDQMNSLQTKISEASSKLSHKQKYKDQ